AIDPRGIIYQVVEGAALPVAGARVFLENIDTGVDVAREDLFAGQQGQVTTAQGFYAFDIALSILPGRFRIRVEPPGPNLIWPSELRPVAGFSAATPFGAE